MSYQVLARKWRPANFQQMVGQEHVVQALVNALDSNRLHHAYLFSGTRGVGKTTIARIFAKSLNCEQGIGSNPCGSCSSCAEIDEGRSVDLIEIDAASRTGVDDMRELLDNVQYAPTRGRFKIYLIDEVHMLSRHSFNALLKTLEEPPPHVKFLLATTDPQKVPVTVLSRCLQFNLKRMSRAQILSQLQYLTEQESVAADALALGQVASAADGSMRDALSLLDQAIGYGGGEVSAEAVEAMLGSISRDYLSRLFDALLQRQTVAMVQQARAVIETNPDYQRVCAEMINLLQQVALYQSDPQLADVDDYAEELLQRYAGAWAAEEIQLYYQILLQGRRDLLISPDAASGFEMLMLRLVAFAPAAVAGQKKNPELKPPDQNRAPAAEAAARDDAPVVPGVDAAAPPTSPAVPAAIDRLPEPPVEHPAPGPGASEPQAPEPAVTRPTVTEPTITEPTPGQVAVGGANPGELDWGGMAYELGLGGLAQEIVANSVCLEYGDGRLRLALQPEIHELATDLIKSEITRAIGQKLGVSLTLELEAHNEAAGQTPLQLKNRRLQQERQAAIDAIRQEPVVQKLRQAFAAELDENSVTRIDEL